MKKYIVCFFILLHFFELASCQEKQDRHLTFAIASDFHLSDIPDGKERLEKFIFAADQAKVDFIIELGDFFRLGSDSNGLSYLNIWDRFIGDKFHVIGNHDMDHCGPNEYVRELGMPARYYSFDKGAFHFIVLDGNNLYHNKEFIHYVKANYYVDPKKRAFVDQEQLEWLKKDIRLTDKRCIIFSHQSIDKCMGNKEVVRDILEKENKRSGFNKIFLAFSGHEHSNYLKEINGITYIQINSASYAWIGEKTSSEKRFSEEVNRKYHLLSYLIPYTKPLYAIVTLTNKDITIKGTKAEFAPPTPKDLKLGDSINSFPLTSMIEDVHFSFGFPKK